MADDNIIPEESVQKFDIKFKCKPRDGVILQLHHTVRRPNGEKHRIRFSTAAFDDSLDRLACCDNGGNLFVLDFSLQKFWKLVKIGPCSAMNFAPNKLDCLAVAAINDFRVSFVDVENGKSSYNLSGHTAPVRHISFSSNKFYSLLTANSVEAILWELTNFTKFFTLNTYQSAPIQQIMFTPAGDYLVSCFQNDTIQIWKQDSMKSVKQIILKDLKHLKSIAFTTNGRAMAMAGLTPTLVLFSMDTWKAIKSIDLTKYKLAGVQQLAFIPQLFDGGSNKILAILSSNCTLHLFNLESLTLIHNVSPESSPVRKLVVSPTGKYFLSVLHFGEVNIYNTLYVMDTVTSATGEKIKEAAGSSTNNARIENKKSSAFKIDEQMKVYMNSDRLRRILMQYGEYPEKHRAVIWASLMDTPGNKTAYSALLDKGMHEAFKDLEKQFTIKSSVALKNLKRLLSCLAHWCPLFGLIKFLPGFVFPFVRVLQTDPLMLFECVASILINHCQLWFEYAPFPPISVLSIIENVLSEHDQALLDYFCEVGVTSQVYALNIMETAFSEILSGSELLILWDHILSNEPSFILMAVVAYNIIQRNALKKLNTLEQFDTFFHNQNPIETKTFLKKIYVLLNSTTEDIHPKRFLNDFVALDKGLCYQRFAGYPKATICLKLTNKDDSVRNEKNVSLRELTTQSQEKIMSQKLEKVKDKLAKDAFSSDDDYLNDTSVSCIQ